MDYMQYSNTLINVKPKIGQRRTVKCKPEKQSASYYQTLQLIQIFQPPGSPLNKALNLSPPCLTLIFAQNVPKSMTHTLNFV